jgi:DNA-binding GntR family transcriptional regulator
MLESNIKNDNFDEKYHMNDKFKDCLLKILLNHKLINSLLNLSFHQTLFLFNDFYDNMNYLINVLNINVDHIKKVFRCFH